MIRLSARALLFTSLPVLLVGCARKSPIDCPEGTSFRHANLQGQKSGICVTEEQKVHGPVVSWHENGKKATEGRYSEGMPDGEFSQWTEDGELLGSYTMTKGSGTLVRWHDNRAKAEETRFESNEREGSSVTWHPDGNKQAKGDYKAGKKHGTWRQWGEDGAEGEVEEYIDGELQRTPTSASDE